VVVVVEEMVEIIQVQLHNQELVILEEEVAVLEAVPTQQVELVVQD
jgi:hypothetical protein